ncbi:unnamed protein product [Arctogadus glacialis]
MAGYELVRLDGGGRIHLPEGETVLGRGPLLGVSDKRVSRQHGLLENQNGCLRLKPVHVNPCFSLQGGALERPQPLERERWHPLRHGELFSLMPGSFIYRVEALGGEALTPSASGGLEGDEGPTGARDSPPHEETLPLGCSHEQAPPALTGRTPPPAAHSPECDAPPMQEVTPTQDAPPTRRLSLKLRLEKEQSGRGFLPKPKRVLPAWMTAGAALEGQSGAGSKQPVPAANKRKRSRAEGPRAGLSSEETRAGLSSELPRASLSSEGTRAGLSSEETRAGLSSELPRASLSSEGTRAGLSSEETRAGLSSEETRAGLSSEGTRAGLSSELPRAGLSSEKTRAGLSSEETRAGLSSEETRAGLSSEETRAGLSSEETRVNKTKRGRAERPKAGFSSEDPGDEDSSGSAPRRKRMRKMSGDANTDKDLPLRHHSNSLGEEDCGRLSDEGASRSDVRPDRKSTAPGGAGSGHAPSRSTRPRCPYGAECYRKNPLHFQECCHPGDHDYQQEEEEPEEEVDLPECPYGIDCYRKNPLHRKEFKHSRRAARSTRTAPSTQAGDDEDEDEYEDSFINDSSDEAFDDSDYVPAGSDDSGTEELKNDSQDSLRSK